MDGAVGVWVLTHPGPLVSQRLCLLAAYYKFNHILAYSWYNTHIALYREGIIWQIFQT